MRCKQCNYRLWNLESRQCPECGTPFLPSAFEFIPNSVEFHCPHCDQAYFGTGPKGHLVPTEFDCGSCGRRIRMDEMVLRPTTGVEEQQTRVDRTPWLERGRRGVVKAWFSTIWMALVNPGRLIRGVPGEREVGEAWWFAVVTNTPILLIGLTPLALLSVGAGVAAAGGGGFGALVGLGVGFVVGMIVIAIGTVFFIALWAAVTHGLLRATGSTATGYPGTGQAICYSTGANALTALPCFGPYFGWVWWLVSAVLMVKEAQKVQGWRAALAVLTFPIVLLFTLIGLYVGLIALVMSRGGPFAANLPMAGGETQAVVVAVSAYAEDHEGHGPAHAIELVSGDYLGTMELVSSQSMTFEHAVPVAGATLTRFAALPVVAQAEAVRRAVNALPTETVAHRLGDFVFTYHGIDLSDPDPELWLVVMTPDPDSNVKPSVGGRILAGRADGSLLSIPVGDLPSALAEQNELRKKHGVAPLPDPTTVTHAVPGAAAGR